MKGGKIMPEEPGEEWWPKNSKAEQEELLKMFEETEEQS